MVSQQLPKGVFLLSAVNYASRLSEWGTVGFILRSEYVRADPRKDLLVLQPYAIIWGNLSIFYFLRR